ncbi:hypothetical protein EW146_g3251 [Bondarzewia mesenterica]|uniref:mRNA 3'-end-processing protein RNA14 n=1 Tax=Bondarzewia mesenterica TaxID=1095465 RepID=A0A4S4LYD0_9AGAM|nr:hypothetical protein EW146_g3251 [Bondarzewia mesenterica]
MSDTTPTPQQTAVPQSNAPTDPNQEILNALQQLNAQQRTTPPEAPNAPTQETPRASVDPPSDWDLLRAQLREKPHDPEGWNRLINLSEDSGELEKIKEAYEALLEMYPNTLISIRRDPFHTVLAHLPISRSVEILSYLRQVGDFLSKASLPAHRFAPGKIMSSNTTAMSDASGLSQVQTSVCSFTSHQTNSCVPENRRRNTGPTTRDIVRKAYEFALNHVGQDKDSGDIWMEYIQFLRSGETSSTWEEQQKMDALRKVYHRAVQIPLENVETLWQELETFENGLNRITAKKFMNDLSPSYMQARTVLRQLQRHLGPLFPPPPPSSSARPTLYLPPLPTFNAAERALVGAWKNYLRWEESNPLEVEDKDKATLITRVQGVYRKAVIRMRFFGEIWYMAYIWTNSVGKTEEAISILKAGIEANPSSFLLNFAYAEILEVNENFTEVHATFDKFLEILRRDLEALEARINASNSSTSNVGANVSQGDANPPAIEGPHSNASSFTTQTSSDERPPKSKELAERRTEYGLVWTMYMRFARRAEGLKSSRGVFGKARKDRWTPWQVYESAALMEYHCNKDTGVAGRIFEKGMEVFGDEADFVSHYLAFLLSTNDENMCSAADARALFERVINNFPADRARPLWERWARHEYQYGDLAAAQKLEKRMAEVYPNDPPIKRFAQRHTYHSTDAIASRDLGVAMARQAGSPGSWNGSSGSLVRTETQQSLLGPSSTQNSSQGQHVPKRAPSPDHKRRSDDYGVSVHKRPRASSPGRDRDRWEGHGRRRYASPSWDRDREKDVPPVRKPIKDVEEEKGVVLPSVLSWFVGTLPPPSSFDGPIFRTDDLMQLFRNAVIPSVSTRTRSPPAPPRTGGRPPPDYGPYQDEAPYFETLADLDEWADTPREKLRSVLDYRPRAISASATHRGKLLVTNFSSPLDDPASREATQKVLPPCHTPSTFGPGAIPSYISRITGIFEWEASEGDCLRLLFGRLPNSRTGPAAPSTDDSIPVSPHYASVLADLARQRGFDGYLLNFEFPLRAGGGVGQTRALAAWIALLNTEMKAKVGPHAEVIWYDSVVFTGHLRWQDRLNNYNLPFFLPSTGLFTNYTWPPHYPSLTTQYFLSIDPGLTRGKTLQHIYTGVDVWGRGSHGGGEFGSYKAMEHIDPASLGMSVALFGQAWTWESEQDKPGWDWDAWWAYERKLWVGPEKAGEEVEVKPAPRREGEPECPHGPFRPLVSFFERRPPPDPAVLPFCTSFCPGIGTAWFVNGTRVLSREGGWTDVDKQGSIGDLLWPRPDLKWEDSEREEALPEASCTFCFDEAWIGGNSLKVSFAASGSQEEDAFFRCVLMPIQSLSITPGKSYDAYIVFKSESDNLDIGLSVNLPDGDNPISSAEELPGGWTKLSLQFTSNVVDVSVGLIIGFAAEDPSQPLAFSILLGQLSVYPSPPPPEVSTAKPRILWADFQRLDGEGLTGALKWEVSATFTFIAPTSIPEAEDPNPIWPVDTSDCWFPSFLYFNIYAQAHAENGRVEGPERALFVGTTGLDGRANRMYVDRKVLPESVRKATTVRFYVQGVTDNGEILPWDRCCFADA